MYTNYILGILLMYLSLFFSPHFCILISLLIPSAIVCRLTCSNVVLISVASNVAIKGLDKINFYWKVLLIYCQIFCFWKVFIQLKTTLVINHTIWNYINFLQKDTDWREASKIFKQILSFFLLLLLWTCSLFSGKHTQMSSDMVPRDLLRNHIITQMTLSQ